MKLGAILWHRENIILLSAKCGLKYKVHNKNNYKQYNILDSFRKTIMSSDKNKIKMFYCKVSNIRHTKYQNLIVSRLGCLCAIYWSQVLSGEWRCSWSSANRRCSNYIWVINNLIAYQTVPYIRDLTVTHCGLVMSYGDTDLGQHWLR